MNHISPLATHLLIRQNEIALKGKNRPEFEKRLAKNILKQLQDSGLKIEKLSGRMVIQLQKDQSPDTITQMVRTLSHVGGIAAINPCVVLSRKDAGEKMENIAVEWAAGEVAASKSVKTFAYRVRRVSKDYQTSSVELETKLTPILFERIKHNEHKSLTLNLKRPDLKVSIEIRKDHCLIYSDEQKGARGLPVDPTQRVVCLLSGGIDSPVAAYEMIRRGCYPVFVHFHSLPFTSTASVEKVKKLATALKEFSPYPLELWLVPLIEIQKQVRDVCNPRYRTLHYRRFMLKIAEELARQRRASAIVTGDALGQVASQTLANLAAIEQDRGMPILRPLIALDKETIIAKAKEIQTYETSLLPHDDTCVLFASERPATQAKSARLKTAEEFLSVHKLVFQALDQAERIMI